MHPAKPAAPIFTGARLCPAPASRRSDDLSRPLPSSLNRHTFKIDIHSQFMEIRTMSSVCKLLLPLAAAAALAIPSVSFADCSPGHGATASMPSSQSVAEQPVPSTPAIPPGNSG